MASHRSLLVRGLVRCYPAALRARYGDELAWHIAERRRQLPDDWRSRIGFACHLLSDTLRAVPREHLRAWRQRTDASSDHRPNREDRMGTLLYDLRHAGRTLLRRPGFTAAVIATLILAIGANTAVFGIIDQVLLRPLPYPAPHQLVSIWGSSGTPGRALISFSDLADMQQRSRTFTSIGAIRSQSVNLTGGDTPDRLVGAFVSASYFAALGTRPAIGRLFTEHETALGQSEHVAVLSYATWHGRFSGARDIVGKAILLNGTPHVVIGVTAQAYSDPFQAEVFLPETSMPPAMTQRTAQTAWAVGRLRPGMSVQAGQHDLDAIAADLAKTFPASNAGRGVVVTDLHTALIGQTRPTLLLTLAAVIGVLLVACTNIVNLQLVRAAGRYHEFSVRATLGASRRRLARQLIVESLLLAAVGGIGALVFAAWASQALVALAPSLPTPVTGGLDARMFAYSFGVSLLAGLSFGALPAVRAGRADLGDALRSRHAERSGKQRWFEPRDLFVGVQLAICVVLLIGAALLGRSLAARQQIRSGMDADRLLTAEFRLPPAKYSDSTQILAFTDRLLTALRAIRGVESAALIQAVPLSGNFGVANYQVIGEPALAPGDRPSALVNAVSDSAFATLGVPLLEGRDFSRNDRLGTPPVVIVTRAFARRHWAGVSPLGRQVTVFGPPDVTATVIGVVEDLHQRDLIEPIGPAIYYPIAQAPNIFNSIVLRTRGDPAGYATALRAALWSVDRDQPVWRVQSPQAFVERNNGPARFTAALASGFSVLALLLAIVGVYGVTAFAVARRTRELGIRMALGARQGQVVRLVLRRGIRVVLIANVTGVLFWLWASRLLASTLYGVSASDLATLLLAPAVLAVVALLACWLPARRASRIDPMIALRQE